MDLNSSLLVMLSPPPLLLYHMRFIPVKWFIDIAHMSNGERFVHRLHTRVSSLLLSLAFPLRSVAIPALWTGTNTTRMLNTQRSAKKRLLLSRGCCSCVVVGIISPLGGTLGILGASKKIGIVPTQFSLTQITILAHLTVPWIDETRVV